MGSSINISKLQSDLTKTAYISPESESTPTPGNLIDAKTLDSHPASYFATKTDYNALARLVDTKTLNYTDFTNLEKSVNELNVQKAPVSSLTRESSTRKTQIDAVNKRIDQLVQLLDDRNVSSINDIRGSVELKDARTGYDGREYNNIGEAIRGQIRSIIELLDDKVTIQAAAAMSNLIANKADKKDVMGGTAFKGSVELYENLPMSNVEPGDFYYVKSKDMFFAKGKDGRWHDMGTPNYNKLKSGVDKLWTNSSPDMGMGNVTINISISTEYSRYIVVNKYSRNDSSTHTDECLVNVSNKIMNVGDAVASRTVTIIKPNDKTLSVIFSRATIVGADSVTNDLCIPIEIYGIN